MPSEPLSSDSPSSAASAVPAEDLDLSLPDALRPAAEALFGPRLELAARFAHLLGTDGVVRGLIGPREAPRIWERHLLNCAALAELIPSGASVVDVGSGAGLPGIVLAVARPDLTIALVEPLARRTAFLAEAVTALGLDDTTTVIRGRAEEVVGSPLSPADVVTARAVAPLDRLAGWCLPLTAVGGRLLALKGSSAAEEIAEHQSAVSRLGGSTPVVRLCGESLLDAPTTVVEIVRERAVVPARSGKASRPERRSASRAGGASGNGRRRRG
ncbi:16S rRNA (guanine527-N7)-methyltransferase [Catenuloplanes niger]|uniref:Ribosomal RNA small subunit methyltransferase G n=1 Tax=Catenuloplanes niger TaxID=587534 RepID=A0AAE4CW92_9ACTN|nr:16S rRNA (guanine527-N7)-methyltransferase [Catenuloplanes niger]